MTGHPEIETERMTLRPLAARDAAALHEIYTDAEAMRYWHTPLHRSLSETETAVSRIAAGPDRAWALVERGADSAIGYVYYLGHTAPIGMGYMLHRGCWGRGLMTEAVRGALEYGFDRLGLDRVELWIDAGNRASQGVAERTGFKRRAVFRQKFPHRDASHEMLVYGLRFDEWRAGAAPRRAEPIEGYGVKPILAVANVQATAEFYRDQLGFRIAFLDGEPPTFAGVAFGDWMATGVTIWLSQAEDPPRADGLSLYLDVGPGLEALFATYRARGVDIAHAPEGKPWGAREFAIRDCNGYLLRFATPG